MALILVKLPNFKVIRLKQEKGVALQSCENLQTFVWWGTSLCPTIQTSVEFHDFEELYLC